jgi:hypothetical protein
MKFLIIFYTCLLSSQIFGQQDSSASQINLDTFRLNDRYIGLIKSTILSQGGQYEAPSVLYTIYLDQKISSTEKTEIKDKIKLQNGTSLTKVEFVDRTITLLNKSQIIGTKLSRSGHLMNQRNNWRIFGAIATAGIALIGAGTGTGIVLSVLVGTTSLIVSTVKDYHANKLLIEAGELMKE